MWQRRCVVVMVVVLIPVCEVVTGHDGWGTWRQGGEDVSLPP